MDEARKKVSGSECDCPLIVEVPDELPYFTVLASRTLLGILVRLTTVEILDAPPESDHDYH
jgi:hypothetical protein